MTTTSAPAGPDRRVVPPAPRSRRLPMVPRRWLRAAGAATTSLAAGGGIAMASAPWEQKWMLPLVIAVWVGLLHGSSPRSAALFGYLFGASYLLTLTAWMQPSVGTDAWLLVGGVMASYYLLLGLAITAVCRLPGWPVWVACVWVAAESAMGSWPWGGFPWARLAWAAMDTPYALWLPWVGTAGVTFLVALTGAFASWTVLRFRGRPLSTIGAAVLMGVVVLGPLLRTPTSLTDAWEAGAPTATVAVVQGNVPGDGTDLVANHREVTRNHVRATIDLASRITTGEVARPDFVLWPENSTAVDPFADLATRRGIDSAVNAVDAPVLVGAIVDAPNDAEVLNQGIVWRPQTGASERYTKRHPVPFGEFIPFRTWLEPFNISRLELVPGDMAAGGLRGPLDIDGIRVADAICFDIAFDDALVAQVQGGAQLITVQTSNAMFIGTSQIEQQFTISRARAMETGRSVVVAAVNGISGVIGPDGRVRASLEPRTTAVTTADVPLTDRQTPAVTRGGLLRRTLTGIGLLAAAVAFVAPRGSRTALVGRLRRYKRA